jgi:hypothetical protein
MRNGEYSITVHKLWNVSNVEKRLLFTHNWKGGGRNLGVIIANSVLVVVYGFFGFLMALLLTPSKQLLEKEEMSAIKVGMTI